MILTRTNHDNAHIKYDIPCGSASNHPVQSMTPYAKKEKIRRKRKLFSARTVQFPAFFPVGGTALAAAVNSPRTKHDSSDDRGCLRWEGWYFASGGQGGFLKKKMVASDHEFASAARHRRFGQARKRQTSPHLEPQKLFEEIIGLFCSSSVLPPHSDMPCGAPSPQANSHVTLRQTQWVGTHGDKRRTPNRRTTLKA